MATWKSVVGCGATGAGKKKKSSGKERGTVITPPWAESEGVRPIAVWRAAVPCEAALDAHGSCAQLRENCYSR